VSSHRRRRQAFDHGIDELLDLALRDGGDGASSQGRKEVRFEHGVVARHGRPSLVSGAGPILLDPLGERDPTEAGIMPGAALDVSLSSDKETFGVTLGGEGDRCGVFAANGVLVAHLPAA
jgi:hypothetical protein